jgi:hypothetical protein
MLARAPIDVVPQILPGGQPIRTRDAGLRVVQLQFEGRNLGIALSLSRGQKFPQHLEGVGIVRLKLAQKILRLLLKMFEVGILR